MRFLPDDCFFDICIDLVPACFPFSLFQAICKFVGNAKTLSPSSQRSHVLFGGY